MCGHGMHRTSSSQLVFGMRAWPKRRAYWFMHSGPSLVDSGATSSLQQATEHVRRVAQGRR